MSGYFKHDSVAANSVPQLPADLPLRGDGRWIFDFKLYFEIIEKKKREKEEKRDRNERRKDRREENWRRWRYKKKWK